MMGPPPSRPSPANGGRSKWFWHAVTGALLLAVAYGIYVSSKTVEYTWHWDRVPQYIVSFQGEVRAPFDGLVTIADDGKSITLNELKGARSEVIGGFETLAVGQGDLVFQNDVIALKPGIRAGPLLLGLWMTLQLSAMSLVFALIIGLVAGLGRVATNTTAHDLSSIYVELIRGTPLLVQIFIVYFFVGTVMHLSAFWAGVVALSVFTGAYVAEIVRAGIQSVARGQMEAARSLGMSYPQAMRHVVMPQALRRSLPSLAGQFINLIKDSSLVSIMALTDLTKAGREIVASTFSPFEVYFSVAAMYLVLTGALSLLVRRLERRMAHD
jgi:polar amino acid transport system permease protein